MSVVDILVKEAQDLRQYREYHNEQVKNAIFWLEIGGYTAQVNISMEQSWLITHPNGGKMVLDYYHLCVLAKMQEDKYNEL